MAMQITPGSYMNTEIYINNIKISIKLQNYSYIIAELHFFYQIINTNQQIKQSMQISSGK